MGNVTTKADFELYKKEADKWVDFFQLRSWHVNYDHAEPPDDLDGCWGWCETAWKDRVCTLGLSLDWKESKVTKERIKIMAFHEVCELLLSRLRIEALVDVSEVRRDEIIEQTHAIIRRLEHAVFK